MQRGLIRLWQVCCFPLLVTLVLLPVPLLMGAYFAPEYMPWIWVWPVGYAKTITKDKSHMTTRNILIIFLFCTCFTRQKCNRAPSAPPIVLLIISM